MNTYFKRVVIVVLLLVLFCVLQNYMRIPSDEKYFRVETSIQNEPTDSTVQSSLITDTCDLENQAYKFNNQKYINFN
jgi:hypothetical protein